jgi:hypothetical protein
VGVKVNPYTILSSGMGTIEAATLSARLSAWHDAMVAHERRLRMGATGDVCDDECPHAEARALWSAAVDAFGDRAQQLTFLRSRAEQGRRPAGVAGSAHVLAEAADRAERQTAEAPAASAATRRRNAAIAAAEV